MPDAPFPIDMPLPSGIPSPADAPFLVQHRREHPTPGRDFTPAARLILMPALRTSGLWAALPPNEIKDFILLLTFLTPNGWARPTLTQLADAMNASPDAAQARMERLTRRTWQDAPLVVPLPREDAVGAYAPARHLLGREEEVSHPAGNIPREDAPVVMETAGREAVLAYSRARYARTRAEVEAEIAQRMGWAPPAFEGDVPDVAQRKRAAYERMTALGMGREQALELLSRFDLDRIERQVEWMGHRHAKSPARFLAAAIENDYDAPLSRRAVSEEAGESAAGE